MNKMKTLFATLLLCLLCYSSQAAAIDLYGFGSYWDQGDADGTWGAGVGISLPIIIDNIRLDGRAHYFGDSDWETDSVKVIPFDFGAQIHLLTEAQVDPYVLGGVSYNYVDSERLDIDSEFGGYLGAGVDIELGSSFIKLFGEFLYRFSDLEDVSGEDIDASGITANIGLKFHLF